MSSSSVWATIASSIGLLNTSSLLFWKKSIILNCFLNSCAFSEELSFIVLAKTYICDSKDSSTSILSTSIWESNKGSSGIS